MSCSWGLALLLLSVAVGGRADDKVVKPFNGLDLKGWKLKGDPKKSKWVVGRAALDEKDARKLAVTPIPPQAMRPSKALTLSRTTSYAGYEKTPPTLPR